tara:strand:- start:20 stop:901 length:882 start_codon:yes stop_codon:yes gene_type:complete
MPNPAVIGVAVYTAWKLGYFDSWWDSTKPPTPEDLNPEILRDVLAKYGKKKGCSQFNPCPLHQKCVRGVCVDENSEPLGMMGEGRMCEECGTAHEGSCGSMGEERMLNEEVPQWVKDCCEGRGKYKVKNQECCNIYQSMTRDFDPLSPPYPPLGNEPMGPLGREMGPFKPPFDVDRDLDLMESNKKYKNMKLTRVKSLIKEQLRRLKEQDMGSDEQQPSLNPNFINNMESLYARKGCTGLMKKSEFFQTKLDRVSQRTGAGMPAWANQLDLKIDHITTMMSQMGCDDDTPTMV